MSLPYLHFIKTNKPCTSDESFTSTPRLKCGVVWEEASPAREGATPGGGCALVESHVQARVRAAEGGGGA